MLQLLFAVAFSAAPLTLYVPPVRSLNPFLEAVEMFVREAAVYTLRAYPRVRLGLRRIFASLNRALSKSKKKRRRKEIQLGGRLLVTLSLDWISGVLKLIGAKEMGQPKLICGKKA
ncbi:uncharacterized protein [Elaeis guineensis]|uniref:Uncharacterized protein LOC105033600 isoform X2 n=1 Tax=Elaeis guineensis var. tenera TaxID=51953 RepID=A0A6I9QD71_ELAGV|nr:uncharacterized protein LOC105033600 isoform X2 [Elaeis guineensis]